MKKYIAIMMIGILLLLPILSGCAVGMALYGKAEPTVDSLQLGMPMESAHFIMRNYTPAITHADGKRIEEYKIQIGNAPSAGRAIGHLAMDVFTWGAWEIIGTPIEAVISKEMTLIIVYEKDGDNWIVSNIKGGKESGGF